MTDAHTIYISLGIAATCCLAIFDVQMWVRRCLDRIDAVANREVH